MKKIAASPSPPSRIRYTRGPDMLYLGDVALQINEWREVTEEIAEQAMLPERAQEYGFEREESK